MNRCEKQKKKYLEEENIAKLPRISDFCLKNKWIGGQWYVLNYYTMYIINKYERGIQ